MKEAGDIVGISIPFVTGVAAVAAVAAVEGVAGNAAFTSLILIIFGLAMVWSVHKPCPFSFAVLFLSLGMLCGASSGISGSAPGPLAEYAESCVTAFRSCISSVPFPHDSSNVLVAALLTGDRSGMTAAQIDVFRASGASHILALSGLHLGVIYVIVDKILAVSGNTPAARRLRSLAIILLTGFYTIMTGAGPSIVRAFLFIIFNEICKLSPERPRDPGRILLCALTIQLAFKAEVIANLGFQLSYLAMAGITLLFPTLSSWYPIQGRPGSFWYDPMRKIWESAALAISCQIFTAPLVWVRFHSFPKYFIITNLLALPLTTGIMAASVATVTLHAIGICPQFLLIANDFLVQALLEVLEVISCM